MIKKMKTILKINLVLLFFILSTSSVFASDYFNQAQIDVTVNKDGSASIEQKVSFVNHNNTAPLEISLGNQKPKNIAVRNNSSQIESKKFSLEEKNRIYFLKIESSSLSDSLIINYELSNLINIEENLETLRWTPIYAESPISSINISVTLPQSLSMSVIESNIYSSQSSTTTVASVASDKKVILTAYDLKAGNDITILVRWPKGLVTLSSWKILLGSQNKYKLIFSFFIGVFIPFGALVAMLVLMRKNKKMGQILVPTEVVNYPPSTLTPVELGILFDKKIYPKEIVATIISLAIKGYLVISNHGDEVVLALKNKPDAKMNSWEKRFFNQIFSDQDNKVSEADIEERVSRVLSSPEIVKLFEDMYQEVTAKGFFVENPHYTRVRYKINGLLFYFLSIFMMLWVLVTNQSSLYLFPIIGLLAVAYVLIKLAPKLPTYTPVGNNERINWLKFKNWLLLKEPMGYNQSNTGIFYDYLPYAIAMGCLDQWITRFSTCAIPIPDWYVTAVPEDNATINQKIIPIIDSISKKLSSLHGPNVS